MDDVGKKLYERYLKACEENGGGGDKWDDLDSTMQDDWNTLAWDLINNCGATL